jgi:hypothetical protein
MMVSEIFDTKFDIQWKSTGRFDLGAFRVNDRTYQVQIETKVLQYEVLKGKKTAEISFSRHDINDSEKSYSTTGEESVPLAVYGIVANNLEKKFKNFDAFYFEAVRRHSKTAEEFRIKREIYSFIADKIAKRTGAYFYENSRNSDQEFLITRIKIDHPKMVIESEEAKKSIIESDISVFRRKEDE